MVGAGAQLNGSTKIVANDEYRPIAVVGRVKARRLAERVRTTSRQNERASQGNGCHCAKEYSAIDLRPFHSVRSEAWHDPASKVSCRAPAVPCLLMTKTELHQLVDALPEESLLAAAVLLHHAQDPIAAKLDAALHDDEELTEGDLRSVRDARNEPGVSRTDTESS
jgi:hypothetical protein